MSDAPFHTAAVVQDVKLLGSPANENGGATRGTFTRTPGPSCQALRHAVSCLYRLDDFELEKIGTGFFSDVYKATHKATAQIMVLKMNTVASNRSNVLREVQLMNGFSHPNILRFIGVCINEGQVHALVEYANGGTLEELLANKSRDVSWPARIRLACDVAKGVKYLHSRNVMHRDLTSKNVLIKEADGRTVAVVADFGLATKIPDPLSDLQLSIVGSPYWMAPECIAGKKYNEKADVFSYGIILCEITARVHADPEILPRTNKFGVDYVAFSKMAADCPLHFLHLTFVCCQIDPWKRPCFAEVVERLEEMKCSALMAVMLADLSRLGMTAADAGNIMSRMILERILDGKRQERSRQEHGCLPDVTATSATRDTSATTPVTQRCIVPVTPLTIGKVMSKDDAHYAPHRENPFPSRFRNATAKLVSSNDNADVLCSPSFELNTPPPTPITPQDITGSSTWYQSSRTWGSHSLPGPILVSRDGSHVFGLADTGSDDGGSSADSALEFDVTDDSCAASGLFIERGRRKSHNAEHAAMMVRCLEQLRVLLDSSVDSSPAAAGNDGSSCASLDEAVFSPTSSMSSRDDFAADMSQRPVTADCRLGPQERFRKLLERWEAGQADVVLPARFRFADPHVMQRFGELRRMWESQQITSDLSPSPAAAAVSSRSRTTGRRSQHADKP